MTAFGPSIADVLGLLGVEGGPLYNAVLSRLRYLAKFTPSEFKKKHPTGWSLLEAGACDAVKLFIKSEPHHKRKALVKKWRLIFNLSLIDQLVDRMLFAAMQRGDLALWPLSDTQVGIGFSHDQTIAFLSHLKEVIADDWETLEGDFSGWDWSLVLQDFEFDAHATLDRYESSGDEKGDEQFVNAVMNRYWCVANKVVAFSDGHYRDMSQDTAPGVMPSGWFLTAFTNSRVAASVLRRIAKAAGAPLKVVKTMGDDNFSAGPKLPTADQAIDLAIWFGKILSDVKHHPGGLAEGFDFCSQTWSLPDRCRPAWHKMVFSALGKEPTVENVFSIKMELSRLDQPLYDELTQFLSNVGWDVVNNIAQMRKAAAKQKPKMGGSLVTQPRPKKAAPIGYSSKPAAAVVAKQKKFTAGSPQIQRRQDGSIRVVHKEYVMDLLGTTATFTLQVVLAVNPGLTAVFPWLSQLAALYEGYRFHKLKFTYETDAPTSTGGSMMMAMDYDAADNVPTTKQELLSMRGAVKAATWENFAFNASPKDMYTMGPRKYVRTTTLSGVDIKTYDVGTFFQAAGSQAGGSTTYGELFVEYDIELFDPQTNTNNLSAVNVHNQNLLKLATISGLSNTTDFGYNSSTTKWATPFGTGQDSTGGGPQPMGAATGMKNAGATNPAVAGTGACAQNGIFGTVLNIVEAGEYLLEINYNGAFNAGSPNVTITQSANVTVNTGDAGATEGTWFGTASGSAVRFALYVLVAATGQSSAATMGNWINFSALAPYSGVQLGGLIVRLIRCFTTFAQAVNSIPLVNSTQKLPAPPRDEVPMKLVFSDDPKLRGRKPLTMADVFDLEINHPRGEEMRNDLLSRVRARLPRENLSLASAAAPSSDFQFQDVSPLPASRDPVKVHYHQGASCPKCILSRIEYADGTFGGVSREFCRECTAKRFSGDLVAGQKVTITSDGREEMPLGDHIWSREWGKQ